MIEKLAKTLSAALVAGLALSAFGISAQAAVTDDSEVSYNGSPEAVSSDDALPERYSSADLGYTTSVKNQQYLDCWAYASLGTLESALLRAGKSIGDMSEDHLNFWATTRSGDTGWIRNTNQSGYSVTALGYMTSWQGGVELSDISDFMFGPDVTPEDIPDGPVKYGVTAVRYQYSTDRDSVKRAIMEHGGVYSSYAQSSSCMSSDGLSYYMPPDYSGSYSGHAIEIVGWNDNYSRMKFGSVNERPSAKGAWLIKNSWGDNNSLGGYFWMSYEDKYILNTKYKPSYSIEEFETLDGTKKLVQNEIYGATYEFGYIYSGDITFLNKLSFDKNYPVIDKVVFESESKGSDYNLYFVPDKNGAPEADKTKWKKLADGKITYQGYHCIDISDFDLPSQSGWVAVNIISNDEYPPTIGVGEWLTTSSGEYVFKNETKRGDCYVSYDGNMTDAMDYYKNNLDDDLGGSFVIKAVSKSDENFIKGDVNLDGVVNINDATMIQRYIAGIESINLRAQNAADFDGDGQIKISDATEIQKFIAS